MQINIDKKTGLLLSIIAALVLVIAFISFGSQEDEHNGRHEMGMQNKDMKKFAISGSDQMFLQMMIPHHEQAVEMSELAIAKSNNAEILKLATQIKDAQSAEIILMKSWLKDAQMSEHMGHDMDHGMAGMMSPEEMASLKGATGKEFDNSFLTSMIAHHEGALHMIMMISDSNDPNLQRLYTNIAKTQSEEITLMKKLLS
ncbi:MAG: DUF305 domain-containing protein [Candidatus Nanopelagicaceae bacterium]